MGNITIIGADCKYVDKFNNNIILILVVRSAVGCINIVILFRSYGRDILLMYIIL